MARTASRSPSARASSSSSRPSRKAPKPTTTSRASAHERPRRQQHVDPLGDDQLADEAHVAVAGDVEPAQGARGDAGVAREGALAAVVPARVQPLDQGRDPRGGVVARAELVDVDARRPEPGALGQARRPASPPTATRPCGASRRGPSGRPPAPPAPRAGSAAVALDDVLQGAAVDLHRVRHPAAQPAGEDRRPHDEMVGERHVGQLPARRRRARRRRWPSHRPRSRRRCTPAACAPRSPRSDRRRRQAAGDRCPGATPSRGPARAAS